MATNVEQVNEIYENFQPLNNFGRRLFFQKYCLNLVKDGLIKEDDVEEFLTEEFLFEGEDEDFKKSYQKMLNEKTINARVKWEREYNISINLPLILYIGFAYVLYRKFKDIFS